MLVKRFKRRFSKQFAYDAHFFTSIFLGREINLSLILIISWTEINEFLKIFKALYMWMKVI